MAAANVAWPKHRSLPNWVVGSWSSSPEGRRALAAVLAIVVFYWSAPRSPSTGWGEGPKGMYRHAMSGGVPTPYRGMDKPLSGSDEAIRAGMKLYFEQSAVCSGGDGAGNGPAATGQSAFSDQHPDGPRRLPLLTDQ